MELLRLAGELRALDPAITAQRLIVQRRQQDLGVTARSSGLRYRTELAGVTGLRDRCRGQRDEAERLLVGLLANRVRLLDETVERMRAHAAVLSHREPEVDLAEYLDRVAALADALPFSRSTWSTGR
jgi:hypothetical protein